MTPLVIIQIVYGVINIIGLVVGLIWFYTAFEIPFIETFLAANPKRWVRVMLSIIEILLVLLFVPAIAVLTIISLLFTIIGINFGE